MLGTGGDGFGPDGAGVGVADLGQRAPAALHPLRIACQAGRQRHPDRVQALALDLGGDVTAERELCAGRWGEQAQPSGVVGGHAQVGAEQQDRAVVLGVPHSAPHALFDPLHFTGQPRRALGQRDGLATLHAIHRARDTVEDQQLARPVGQVDAVVLVHQHHHADVAHFQFRDARLHLVDVVRSVGILRPLRGDFRPGNEHDDVDRFGLRDTVAVAVTAGELQGQDAHRLIREGRVERDRNEDQAIAEVGGTSRRDCSGEQSGISTQIGYQDAVVREGGSQIDPAAGAHEGRDRGDWRARWADLHPAARHGGARPGRCPAPGR